MSVFKMFFKLVQRVSRFLMFWVPCGAVFRVNGWVSNELLVIEAMEKVA
ncbi:hypothetical protein [Marinomonas atlantica]|nr:hypothetical protein [Marinomonas atlantica]